jgi:SAM-dependent methyltransferase
VEADARKIWSTELAAWFRDNAYRYGEATGCPYPFFEIRRDHVLAATDALTPGRVLDVGSGGAHLLIALHRRGWVGEGCDFSPPMIDHVRIREALATSLDGYADGSYDLVLCLGPAEYVGSDEVRRVYAEARRVLTPGGRLICAHVNQLFDLMTLDRFTVDLLQSLLVGSSLVDQVEGAEIAELLRRRFRDGAADAPPPGSLRSRLQVRVDNPLTAAVDLSSNGFLLEDTIFYRFYAAPPFVTDERPELTLRTVAKETTLAHDWRGHFLASSFLTVSRRVAD